MKVEQIYTGCLAEAAYYIESNGEAAIIDPLRETKPYIDKAKRRGARIKYILETHFHADFVSGHIDLAKKTGATIVFGPTASPAYEAHIAADGEILKLGDVQIKVLHTPGHTMESTTYLLIDEKGQMHCLFTGDTLFIGDVGRPDLVQKVKKEITPEILAGYLYDSLRNKIMPLPDDLIVYPGHGAGSACGKNMSRETTDTLGHQKQTNYALRPELTKEQFIREVTEGLVEPPQYFPYNVLMNLQGGMEGIDAIIRRGTNPLSLAEFKAALEVVDDAMVLDTRSKEAFAAAHIPGSIFIGIDDTFAPWAGTLISELKQPILFIADAGREEEVVTRLARVGYDHTIGYLQGSFETWKSAGLDIDTVQEIEAARFAELYQKNPNLILLDVRRKSEFNTEHIEGAENFPLDFINQNMSWLNKDHTYYLQCAGGYRSTIAASILKARGFHKLITIRGGYKALRVTSLPRSEHHEQRSML